MIKILFKLINRYKTLIKFGISGVLATTTHFATLYILTEFAGLYYLVSAGIGFLAAFGVSFSLQKFWTFRDPSKDRIYRQIIIYFLVVLAGLIVNTIGMYVLVDIYGLWYMLAEVIVAGGIALGNFMMYKFVIFRPRKGEEPRDAGAGRNERKKILITTPLYPPLSGGPATYVKLLQEKLPAYGYDAQVVTYADPGDADGKIDLNSPLIRINRRQGKLKKYFLFWRAVFNLAPRADIIYTQDQVNAGLPTCLACYLRGREFVLKVVGDWAWEQAQEQLGLADNLDEFQNKKYSLKIGLWRVLRARVAKEAAMVITPSEYLRGIVSGWGVKREKIRTVYNAVPVKGIKQDKQEIRESLGLGSGPMAVSSIRLLPWKGWSALIDITPELARRHKGFSLVINGDGPDRGKLEEKLSQAPGRGHIKFIPSLAHDELLAYFKAADVFILNSAYEGLSHVVIENQYLGTPVVTTAAGGNPEAVKDGQTGLLVEYNDKDALVNAVDHILSHPEKAARMAERAKSGLDKFKPEYMVAELVKIFADFS